MGTLLSSKAEAWKIMCSFGATTFPSSYVHSTSWNVSETKIERKKNSVHFIQRNIIFVFFFLLVVAQHRHSYNKYRLWRSLI